jgi:septal ring factor EnvC (AmiA/AmiB activator)
VVRAQLRSSHFAVVAALALALLLALVVAMLSAAPPAGAVDAEGLEGKLAGAREEAGALAAELRESRAAISGAEAEAAAAAARESELSGLLAAGQERTAELGRKVERTRARLASERARLQRARAALAARLVAIYESGEPDTASVILASGDLDELASASEYLSKLSAADTDLAERIAAVRDEVAGDAERVEALEREAIAHEEALAAAREEIGAARAAAQATAAELQSVSASREASLADLRGRIDGWVAAVERSRAAAAASEAEAEEEVGRWLGGPYSIPTYIVMCESGGDYGALNASSGAGGAYQVIPSTWAAYGGKGEPQNAPKAEQDRIAAEIWADSGGGAWVCA